MAISVLMQQILIIFLEIGVGIAAAKCGIIRDEHSKFLSDLVMSVTLPCSLLASANVPGGTGTVPLILLGAGLLFTLYLVCIVICQGLARAMHLSAGKKAVLVTAAVLPNSAFIGIPLSTAVLGEAVGTLYATCGIISYNVLFFVYMVRLFEPESKFRFRSLLTPTNIATFAMVIMLLLGVQLPDPLQRFCSTVGGCTTPLALMIAGAMLARSRALELITKPFLYLVTFLRCILFPLAFILVLWLLPLDRTMCMGISILAACPASTLSAVLARQHDMESELASQIVAQSTVFILISVPLLLMLAGTLFA